MLLVDAMPGVRQGLRWTLGDAADIVVSDEAGTAAAARRVTDVDVIVTGLLLPDGSAADIAAAVAIPVVVHTWLPPDERDPAWTLGVAAVVQHGLLRAGLARAIRTAASQQIALE